MPIRTKKARILLGIQEDDLAWRDYLGGGPVQRLPGRLAY
jgi:hypothetical protein